MYCTLWIQSTFCHHLGALCISSTLWIYRKTEREGEKNKSPLDNNRNLFLMLFWSENHIMPLSVIHMHMLHVLFTICSLYLCVWHFTPEIATLCFDLPRTKMLSFFQYAYVNWWVMATYLHSQNSSGFSSENQFKNILWKCNNMYLYRCIGRTEKSLMEFFTFSSFLL